MENTNNYCGIRNIFPPLAGGGTSPPAPTPFCQQAGHVWLYRGLFEYHNAITIILARWLADHPPPLFSKHHNDIIFQQSCVGYSLALPSTSV